jgi:hypothetical protein
MTMDVVYAVATGHVLGVRSGVGLGTGVPAVADLVGPALPLRRRLSDGTLVELAVPAAMLGAGIVADTPDALLDPMMFQVRLDAAGTVQAELVRQTDGGAGELTVTLTTTSVKVDVGAAVTATTPVLVIVSGHEPLSAMLQPPERITELGARLQPTTTYGVLVLVAGRPGRFIQSPLT